MRLFSGVIVLFLAFLGCEGAINVDPMKIVLEVPPGTVKEGAIVVTNLGDEPTTVSVRLSDFFLDERGNLLTLEPGTMGEMSLTGYLSFSPTNLSLEPGEAGQVSYRLQLPTEATGSHWACLLIAEEEPEVVEEEQGGIILRTEVRLQYAVTIYQNPLNRPSEPWVRVKEVELSLQENENGERIGMLVLAVENLTDIVLTPKGKVEIRDPSGTTVAEKVIEEFTLLPHGSLAMSFGFQAGSWEAGEYLGLAVIDARGETLAAGQAIVEIPPP